MEYIFWILLGVILYTYVGYTLLLLIFSFFKRKTKFRNISDSELPEVTIVIAAYNESKILQQKIDNSKEINYPKDKLYHIWVTDGSTDGSEVALKQCNNIQVLHQPNRNGKMAAINRAMQVVKSPITIFCDANTMLHPDSIKWMARSLSNPKIGCVAGEKRIINLKKDSAAGSGEQTYWSYESLMKRLESKVGTTVGAAGELFGIKTELFEAPDSNTVVDDFVVSLKIALKGYKIAYQPKAIATENASFSIADEKKRKIRIAAGSFQVLFGMPKLFNLFKHGMLSFQYISHKVLRWLIVPGAIPALVILNILILLNQPENLVFRILLLLQAVFYLFAILGKILQNSKTRLKLFFIPYYIIMMNHAIAIGFIRYLKGSQTAVWEKAKRQD